jgi:DNA-binding beta-propeller fold protein YncE
MIRISFYLLITALMVSFSLTSLQAETPAFRYLRSIYLDEKGAGLNKPGGVACHSESKLVVADSGNGRLLMYTFLDRNLKGGSEIKLPQLPHPIRVQFNSKGEVFALDGKVRRIVHLNPEGAFKEYLSPEGLPSPSTFVPKNFRIGQDGRIYVLDIFSARILILTPEGKYLKQVGFPKDYGFLSDLMVHMGSNILLLDSVRARVYSINQDSGDVSLLAAHLRDYLDFPVYMTSNSAGMIYIVDQYGDGIVLLGPDGSFLGRQLAMGWNEGYLRYPSQICLNEKGEIFIADTRNNRIQIFMIVK